MSQPQAVVIVGMGELGVEFARGFLLCGHAVIPVLRQTSQSEALALAPNPRLVLVAVGEADLASALESLPAGWKERIGLVQNELLPADWKAQDIDRPTVCVVWFEKKAGNPSKVLLPSRVCGPHADLVIESLSAIGIPTLPVAEADIELELISKNLYILLVNLAGLRTGGTVEELWRDHRTFAMAVGREVLQIQEALVGHALDSVELFRRFEDAVLADPHHLCTGRSASQRLARALAHGRRLGLTLPTLQSLARDVQVSGEF